MGLNLFHPIWRYVAIVHDRDGPTVLEVPQTRVPTPARYGIVASVHKGQICYTEAEEHDLSGKEEADDERSNKESLSLQLRGNA